MYMYLIRSLVSSTVGALHSVAEGNPQPPPDHHTSCGLFRFLHCKTAHLQTEGWGNAIQDLRENLRHHVHIQLHMRAQLWNSM